MRLLFCWQLSVLLLLAGMTAAAQTQNAQSPASPPEGSATQTEVAEAPATPTIKPGVTVTGKPPPPDRPLPKLPPDEFTNCMNQAGVNPDLRDPGAINFQARGCNSQFNMEVHI